jgi:hypothetical protein
MSYTIPLVPELLDVLISHNVDLNFNDLLEQAIYNYDIMMCKKVIKLGADPTNISLLFSCVSKEYSTKMHRQILELLLSYHGDINSLRYHGNPILFEVTNVKVLRFLLKMGADWKLTDANGTHIKHVFEYKQQIYCENQHGNFIDDTNQYSEMLQILDEYETHSLTKRALQ